MQTLRKENLMSLEDVSKRVNKSAATLSRYENNLVDKIDLELVEKIADVLDTSAAYLLGMTEDINYIPEVKTVKYYTHDNFKSILITDDQMAPEMPEGACVQIRELEPNESLVVGGYYYIEFNDNKVFRMVVEDNLDGIGFLPMDMSERRIAYDTDYVKIIGKAVSMKVFFEDKTNCNQ